MEKVRVKDLENRMGPADVKRPLSRALGAEHVAANYYELAPGESFAFGYHSHAGQEELFVIFEGTVSFETADGDVAVGAGEAIRFEPGESQRGVNAGDERVVALAIGAPRDPGELSLRRECAQCGTRTPTSVSLTDDREAIVTTCLECGTETGRYTE